MRCTTKTCRLTGDQPEQYMITETATKPIMSASSPPATIFTAPSVDGSGVPMPPPPKPSTKQQDPIMNIQVDEGESNAHTRQFSEPYHHQNYDFGRHDTQDAEISGNDDEEFEKFSSSSRDAARIMERYGASVRDEDKTFNIFNFNNIDHHPHYNPADSRHDDYEEKFGEYSNQRESCPNDVYGEELQYEYQGPATYHNEGYQNLPHRHYSSSFSISTKSEMNVMDKVHNHLQKVSFNDEYDDHKKKSPMNAHSIMRPPLSPSMSKDNGIKQSATTGQNNVSHNSTMTTKSSTNSRMSSKDSNQSPNSSATTAIAASNLKEKSPEEEKKLMLKRRSKAKKNMQRRQGQSPSPNKTPSNGNESDKNLPKFRNDNSKTQFNNNMVKSKRRTGTLLSRKAMDDTTEDDLELLITHHFQQMEERLEQRLEEMESRIDFKLSKLNRLLQLVSNAQEQPEQSYKYRFDKHSDASGGKKLVVVLDNN